MLKIPNERICRTVLTSYTGRRRYNCSKCGTGIAPGEPYVQDRIPKEPNWNWCRKCATEKGFDVPDEVTDEVVLKEETL